MRAKNRIRLQRSAKPIATFLLGLPLEPAQTDQFPRLRRKPSYSLSEHARQSLDGGTAVLLRCLDRSFARSLAAAAFRKIHNGVGKLSLRLDYIKDRVCNRIA
jgi:hypothetical protein